MSLASLHKPIYENRIKILSTMVLKHLKPGDRVLDVGSGSGYLAKTLVDKARVEGLEIEAQGIEKHPRGGEEIETLAFDGYEIPCEDDFYDVTLLADVVHHEEDYMRLLREVTRVTKRFLIIKDHTPRGFLGQWRICLMDWAANNPYGVKCLYRYFTAEEWGEIYRELGLEVEEEVTSIRLYQEPFNLIFGNRLQYLAVLRKGEEMASIPV